MGGPTPKSLTAYSKAALRAVGKNKECPLVVIDATESVFLICPLLAQQRSVTDVPKLLALLRDSLVICLSINAHLRLLGRSVVREGLCNLGLWAISNVVGINDRRSLRQSALNEVLCALPASSDVQLSKEYADAPGLDVLMDTVDVHVQELVSSLTYWRQRMWRSNTQSR